MQRFLSIGVMAHVDAGKTTFSEQLLYHTGSIRTRGRVDHQDAFLDNDRLERERGITIFSNHAPFSIGEHQYWLLDTPGHADFGAEMERAIQAMDYAIVLVSCVEGIQAHTEQVWKLLKRYGVPVFFFLNKTDRTGARPDEVLHQLQKRMSSAVCDCSGGFGEDAKLNEELIEQIAAEDEELMEMYLDGGYEEERWLDKMAQLVAQRELPLLSRFGFAGRRHRATALRTGPPDPCAARCRGIFRHCLAGAPRPAGRACGADQGAVGQAVCARPGAFSDSGRTGSQ